MSGKNGFVRTWGEVPEKLYYYGMLFRPPMPGAQPRDGLYAMYDAEMTVRGRKLWGYVVYERELTKAEIEQYELLELKPEDIAWDGG